RRATRSAARPAVRLARCARSLRARPRSLDATIARGECRAEHLAGERIAWRRAGGPGEGFERRGPAPGRRGPRGGRAARLTPFPDGFRTRESLPGPVDEGQYNDHAHETDSRVVDLAGTRHFSFGPSTAASPRRRSA